MYIYYNLIYYNLNRNSIKILVYLYKNVIIMVDIVKGNSNRVDVKIQWTLNCFTMDGYDDQYYWYSRRVKVVLNRYKSRLADGEWFVLSSGRKKAVIRDNMDTNWTLYLTFKPLNDDKAIKSIAEQMISEMRGIV
jgi:hypothetical protein